MVNQHTNEPLGNTVQNNARSIELNNRDRVIRSNVLNQYPEAPLQLGNHACIFHIKAKLHHNACKQDRLHFVPYALVPVCTYVFPSHLESFIVSFI